jgi:hypothetical protein
MGDFKPRGIRKTKMSFRVSAKTPKATQERAIWKGTTRIACPYSSAR